MGLWQFVIAEGMTWRDDATEEVRQFLNEVTLSDLEQPKTWKLLRTLVRIQPEWDILPVRAPYSDEPQATISDEPQATISDEPQATIGANHLKTDAPLWLTLADCIASKLLHGITPKIIEALVFEPGKRQAGLRPVPIGGNPDCVVDPVRHDFYKRLVETRNEVKARRDRASGDRREALDTEQNAIKIAANATSYGIFVEINVKERAKRCDITVHNSTGPSYVVETVKAEEPGRCFHPVLAALITGAARLMLAITERLVSEHGLQWTFCDTDSIAIARPDGLPESEFYSKVDSIVGWFSKLNPYDFGGSILKIEDVNFSLTDAKTPEPLYCWAVSAKRYALFNKDADGRPVLRKASAHGLGHLQAPYDKNDPAPGIPQPAVPLDKLKIELWQHDLWWKIVSAALAGTPTQVDLSYHPALIHPAVSRYAATTPKQLRWFSVYNENRADDEQVKPFGFLYALYADPLAGGDEEILGDAGDTTPRRAKADCKPVAPYDKDLSKAIAHCRDRETGLPVAASCLKSFKQVIVAYHLHPESKFENGDYLDGGLTERRYVYATAIRNIGKEANEWEPQYYTGYDEDEEIDYGLAPESMRQSLRALRSEIEAFGQRKLARESGISRRTISKIMHGAKPGSKVAMKLRRTLDSGPSVNPGEHRPR
jgi:hypothetical protein